MRGNKKSLWIIFSINIPNFIQNLVAMTLYVKLISYIKSLWPKIVVIEISCETIPIRFGYKRRFLRTFLWIVGPEIWFLLYTIFLCIFWYFIYSQLEKKKRLLQTSSKVCTKHYKKVTGYVLEVPTFSCFETMRCFWLFCKNTFFFIWNFSFT